MQPAPGGMAYVEVSATPSARRTSSTIGPKLVSDGSSPHSATNRRAMMSS